MRHRRTLVVFSVLAAISAAVAVTQHHRTVPQVFARTTSTTSPVEPTVDRVIVRADGRVIAGPHGQVTVGAEMAGTIAEVLVDEGDVVRAGQPLVTFRSTEHKAAAGEAVALTREASAAASFLDREVKRAEQLVDAGAVPQHALDKLVFERTAARAKLSATTASSRRLWAAAGRTRLVSPIAGTVVMRKVEPGETVLMGAPLFVVADLSRLRVSVEVDEFDALRVAPGMKAGVTVDGLIAEPFVGVVEEIGHAIVPRRIRPQDPTRPTEPQVLEVKVMLEGTTPLKLGQRVNVTLAAGGASSS
jgi:RND family efflux transporter MFP subunit